MFTDVDTPDEAFWLEVGGEGRLHPYAMHRHVNRDDVEVVSVVSDEENHPKRWVVIQDGEYRCWVKVTSQDEYGYELRTDEQVSDAELEAIALKHAAIRDGSSVSVEAAKALVDRGEPGQVRHALIALYYAAKADSGVPDEDVARIREVVTEYTGHVDTSHHPTVMGILRDVPNSDEATDTA